MPVIVIDSDARFRTELTNAGTKLVVVDFFGTRCGPCIRIAPFFEELSRKYPRALFLKVDVEICQETSIAEGVRAMPTFAFYRNKVKLTQLQGANPQPLENTIKELLGPESAEDGDSCIVPGHVDLVGFIAKNECECLNESDDHTFVSCLSSGGGHLESDCDEQLIISIGFNQAVRLHSLKVEAPPDSGPKTLKLFINQPRTLDFDQADSMEPVQMLELTADDVKNGNLINLRYVKFQNVQNLQIFVKNNIGGTEVTRIDHLAIIGSPINTTNMGEFKRVAGKKGESH